MLDGSLLSSLYDAASAALERRREGINRINTFPIPDGDSGTNMWYTMQAAAEAGREALDAGCGAVAKKAARAALLAARGNSGIILSQILAGMARGLEGKEKASPGDFRQALGHASERAYQSVAQPVEGTILTVMRAAAEAASATPAEVELPSLLDRVVVASQDALARTPELLPSLKQAGVVDAGGLGLLTIFEGMRDASRYGAQHAKGASVAARGLAVPRGAQVVAPPVAQDAVYGVEVQCLLLGPGLDLAAVRAFCLSQGDSVLVVGDEDEAKVHVHTRTPQAVVDFLVRQGDLSELTFEDLDAQAAAFGQLP